jgi:hypothetical protein
LGSTVTRTRGRREETTTGKRFVGAAAVAVVVAVGVSLGVAPAGAQAGPIRVVVRASDTRLASLDFDRDGRLDMGDGKDASSETQGMILTGVFLATVILVGLGIWVRPRGRPAPHGAVSPHHAHHRKYPLRDGWFVSAS